MKYDGLKISSCLRWVAGCRIRDWKFRSFFRMLSCRSLRLSGNIYCEDIIDGLPAKGKFLILAIGKNRARNTERAKVADLEAITNLMY